MAKETGTEEVEARVRRRLRELRNDRGLTLEAVAKAASIDVSTLSRLESGKRRLSLDHLPALTSALGVSTDHLLESTPTVDPRVRDHVRKFDGLTMWPLTRRGAGGGVQAFKVRIQAERRTPPPELPVHEGNDWIYVLEGRMRLLLGEEDMVIEPGEAVEFSTWTPHWFGVVEEAVDAIFLMGPHGERLHLHP